MARRPHRPFVHFAPCDFTMAETKDNTTKDNTAKDSTVPFAFVEIFYSMIPAATKRVVEDSGHLFLLPGADNALPILRHSPGTPQ